MTVGITKSMILLLIIIDSHSATYTASASSLTMAVEAATHALHLLLLSTVTVPYSRID